MSGVQVIDRAVQVLRVLADSQGPMQLRDIALGTGLSTTTVHRILGALVQNTLCEREPDGRYGLGLTLFELGARVQAGLDLRERSRPPLTQLADATDLTSFLCVRRDNRAICLERINGRNAFTLALEAGGSLPLHVGAAPRVLLAYDSEPEIRRHLQSNVPLQRFTARTLIDPDAVLEDLAESRARGWTLSDEDVTDAVSALGAPVFGFGDTERPVAAVSVAGLRPHVMGAEHDRIVDVLLDTASSISEALGASVVAGKVVDSAESVSAA
jgi:DNA-binding IclR family transcriptional regulator